MNYSTSSLLLSLEKTELDFLFRDGQKRVYAKNMIIIDVGDSSNCAYFINSGRVKIFLGNDQGREIVLGELKAGEHFGEMALIDSQRRSAKAVAMENTELMEISQNTFRACLQSHPLIAERIMLGLVARLREADKKISSLALLSVSDRVENMLLGLAKTQDGVLVIEKKPTHQHIANSIGSSREMVTRILKRMKSDGRIRIEGKRCILERSGSNTAG